MKRNFIFGLAFVFTVITPQVFGHKDGGIVVKNAWVREAPPVAKVLAAYLSIENHTGKARALTSVASPAFDKIEFHKTVQKDGMASMEQQDKLFISAESAITLEPNGTHLMLFNPAKPLKAGDKVNFVLTFSDGTNVTTDAVVKKGISMDQGHHHTSSEDHHSDDHSKERSDKHHSH